MAADTGRAGRARHRDLADLDRGAAGLPAGAHGARQGLRGRRKRHRAAACALSDEGCRAVRACRPGGSAGAYFPMPEYATFPRRCDALRAVAGDRKRALRLREDPMRWVVQLAVCLLLTTAPAAAEQTGGTVTILVP